MTGNFEKNQNLLRIELYKNVDTYIWTQMLVCLVLYKTYSVST